VVDVVAGSAAARANLKAGDVIVAIDGKPWASTTLSALRNMMRAAPDTKIRLKLVDGTEHTVTLADIV
jgi:C-terminal processing protease CtpA/Prc